ncbi:MAG: hypothetical protein ACR2KK_23945 [Acidimicrobiales bacterium]
MAYGLPVEGTDGPFLGGRLSAPTTCDVGLTVGQARGLLEESGAESVIVLASEGLAVGEFDAGTLHGQPDDKPLLAVMDPVPTTVRPSVTVASAAGSGGGRSLVTTSDGRLLGEATVEAEADDHAGHDHAGHDHAGHDGDQAEEFEQELTRVMGAIEERFGDREPSEAELRSFLHDRLVAEGRSVEDADQFLDQLEAGAGD